MIDPQSLDLSTLPWLPLDARSAFPRRPAIYFAIDRRNVVQYIGKAVDVKARWSAHHRYDQLQSIGGVRVAYLFLDDLSLLLQVERALIAWFNPALNVADTHGGGLASIRNAPRKHYGFIRNKIKQFLDSRGITPYQFEREAGVAHRTAYDLYNNPYQIPSSTVLTKICDTYKVQPGELLEWVES